MLHKRLINTEEIGQSADTASVSKPCVNPEGRSFERRDVDEAISLGYGLSYATKAFS